MFNVHTPERQPHETFEQYKQRRAASHTVVALRIGPGRDLGYTMNGPGARSKRKSQQDAARELIRSANQPKFRKPRKQTKTKLQERETYVKGKTFMRVGRPRRIWRHGEPLIFQHPMKHLKSLLRIGKDKEGQPIYHRDMKTAQFAAQYGHGAYLHHLVGIHHHKKK